MAGSARIVWWTLMPALVVLSGCEPASETPVSLHPTFGAATRVGSPAGPGAGEPWLFVEPDGAVLMSWLEPAAEGHALRFAVLENDLWSPVRTVVAGEDLFVNWADFPSVLRLPDGSLVAHWLQRTGPETYSYGVQLARSSDDGETWSRPVTPHTDGTPTEHGFVSLIPGQSVGSVRAVWLDGRNFADPEADPPFMSLRHAAVAADGSLSEERELDPRTCDCCQTSAATTDAGIVVAYRGRTAVEIRDIRVIHSTADGWTAPSVVHGDGWLISACPVNGPAIDAKGDLVAVAWFTAANDSPRVMLAFSHDAGMRFGTPIEVASSGEIGRSLGRVDLELTPGGVALVSWLHEREGTTALMLAALDSAGSRSVTTVVPQLDGGRATGFPRLAFRGDEVLLAWTEPGDPAEIRIVEIPLMMK